MSPADDFPRLDKAIREAASDWFGVMRGDEAETRRAAFEAWRARDPAHAVAYDQLVARWEQTAFLGGTRTGRSRHLSRAPFHERRPLASAALAVASVLAISVGTLQLLPAREGPGVGATDGMRLASTIATGPNMARIVALQDGSTITLDRNTRIEVVFTDADRSLRLLHGRARFEVAHADRQPFVVSAAGTSVIAHGTIFDVALTALGGRVILLRGAVEVRSNATRQPRGSRFLHPGQQLEFVSARALPAPQPVPAAAPDWVAQMIPFDGARLGDAVARMNAGAAQQIVLAPGLADLAVSGAFHAGNTRDFAKAIAAMFDLRLVERSDGGLILIAKTAPHGDK